MRSKKVPFDIKIYDNYIEIIPKEGVKDNSLYEVQLKNLRPANSIDEIEDFTVKFVTAMTPMFATILDVSSLIDIVEIPEDIVLYNIREASKYAEYIYDIVHKRRKKINHDNIPFAVKEFTRYKAAKDCLMKIYMSLVSDKMVEGELGEVKFKVRESIPDLKKLLEYLDKEINKWLDAIKGHDLEGRACMKTAVKGYHHGGLNPRRSIDKKRTPKPVSLSFDRGVY